MYCLYRLNRTMSSLYWFVWLRVIVIRISFSAIATITILITVLWVTILNNRSHDKILTVKCRRTVDIVRRDRNDYISVASVYVCTYSKDDCRPRTEEFRSDRGSRHSGSDDYFVLTFE